MRIPREDRPGDTPRLKGFGYVEFEDRESLAGALRITDCVSGSQIAKMLAKVVRIKNMFCYRH